VLKVQLALSRHDARRECALRERAAAEAELRRLAALPDGAALGRAARLPPPAPLPANFAARAAEEAPEVAVARAAAAVAERMLAVERLELLPDFSVGGGLGWRGDLDPAVVAGVGIELPFWRRQRQEPLIRAAESELAATRAAERAAAVTARGAAERLLSDDLRLERQLRLYDEAILPQTSAALDAARASYLAARGDFSMVLEDFELWLDARAARARLDAERFAIRAAIAALVGPAPERGSGAAPGGVEP
jgi:outer membrane protein TolC